MPKTPERTRFTSMPSACTISAFWLVARISRPRRVRSRNCQIADRHDDAGAGEEQTIDRERLVEQEDDAGECGGRLHLQRLGRPRSRRIDLAQHQRQPEGDHQEGAVVAPVQPAQRCRAQTPRRPARPAIGAAISASPEAAGDARRRVADERAQHVERAMREVDDAHDAEDQRQPNAEKEQQRGLRQCVQALRDQEREEVHAASVHEMHVSECQDRIDSLPSGGGRGRVGGG